MTDGAVPTADPAVADCPLPAFNAMFTAGPAPEGAKSAEVAEVKEPDSKIS